MNTFKEWWEVAHHDLDYIGISHRIVAQAAYEAATAQSQAPIKVLEEALREQGDTLRRLWSELNERRFTEAMTEVCTAIKQNDKAREALKDQGTKAREGMKGESHEQNRS